ncbi:YfcC family protein [Craterilacuibacter sinensis]|nr:AbgT family transporter [Craterilacuibacter sinensis]
MFSRQTFKGGSFKLPNIYLILVGFMAVVAVLTHWVPAGSYQRAEMMTAAGPRMVAVAGSFEFLPSSPVTLWQFITAIPDGMVGAADIVFMTLLVGGSVGLIRRTGVVDLGIAVLTRAVGGRSQWLIPLLMAIFAVICGFIGVPELSIAFLPMLLPMFYRMGYDGMTAVAVALLPTTLGFAFGITIPGTVGIGQSIAHLPMFSGAGYRAGMLALVMLVAIAYTWRYAARIKANPAASLVFDSDSELRTRILSAQQHQQQAVFSPRLKLAGVLCGLMLLGVIAAILNWQLSFNAISGLFLCTAVITALVAGKDSNALCEDLNESFREILVGALICGLARAISVLMSHGQVADTIVYGIVNMVSDLHGIVATIAVFLCQALFNSLIPSGSGQTVLTMPVLVPMADLLGITRQTMVLATQMGDGMTNILFPTSGYFIATLAIARVDYLKWLRFFLPLFAMLLLLAMASLALAYSIRLGPF